MHWLDFRVIGGKEYFVPRVGGSASARKAACKEIGAHNAAILTQEDEDAVKTILRDCKLPLFIIFIVLKSILHVFLDKLLGIFSSSLNL